MEVFYGKSHPLSLSYRLLCALCVSPTCNPCFWLEDLICLFHENHRKRSTKRSRGRAWDTELLWRTLCVFHLAAVCALAVVVPRLWNRHKHDTSTITGAALFKSNLSVYSFIERAAFTRLLLMLLHVMSSFWCKALRILAGVSKGLFR